MAGFPATHTAGASRDGGDTKPPWKESGSIQGGRLQRLAGYPMSYTAGGLPEEIEQGFKQGFQGVLF